VQSRDSLIVFVIICVFSVQDEHLFESNEDLEEGGVDKGESSGCAERFVDCEQIKLRVAMPHEEEEGIVVLLEHGVVQGSETSLARAVEVKQVAGVSLLSLFEVVVERVLDSFDLSFLDCYMQRRQPVIVHKVDVQLFLDELVRE